MTLAAADDAYVESTPVAPLRAHFRCVWWRRIPEAQRQPIRVLPDSCVDLIWIDGALSVAGPDRAATTHFLRPGSIVVGLRFQPGAASRWLRVPMSALVDRSVLLTDLWGDRSRQLALCAEASGPAGLAAQLQRELVPRAKVLPQPDPDMWTLFEMLRHAQGPEDMGVAQAASRLGLSERSLRRHCLQEFGYGPKTLARILRFQDFLGQARSRPGTSLAYAALASGYADQAHLNRDCRRLSGCSPRELLAERAE